MVFLRYLLSFGSLALAPPPKTRWGLSSRGADKGDVAISEISAIATTASLLRFRSDEPAVVRHVANRVLRLLQLFAQ